MTGIRTCTGYYRHYDGKVAYVVSLTTDSDNGEEMVIWIVYPFTDVPRYYIFSKRSFCIFVEVGGEGRAKYKRLANMKISEVAIEQLEDESLRGPVCKIRPRRVEEEYDVRTYQQATTYHAYVRELCENYSPGLRRYCFYVNQKRYAAITKGDFGRSKEGLCFLDNALKTILTDYRDYFRKRFVDGPSIHKCAEVHRLNRGSTDYLQRKPPSTLARLLGGRDEAEGECRLR